MSVQKRTSNKFTWAFAGCRTQGLKALGSLVDNGYCPSLIAILPESTPAETKKYSALAKRCGAKMVISANLNDQAQDLSEFDLLLVCRYNLLPKEVFLAPKWGSINIHLGLLPNYRGVHPISWALINGEKVAGLSIHSIDDGIDTGMLIRQNTVDIQESDDIWTLTETLEDRAANEVVSLFKEIQKLGKVPKGKVQGGKGFYARRRKPEDGKIDWSASGRAIFNLVRALQLPIPNAFFFNSKGEKIDVLKCQNISEPGKVLAQISTKKFLVQNGDSVSLIETSKKLRVGETLK